MCFSWLLCAYAVIKNFITKLFACQVKNTVSDYCIVSLIFCLIIFQFVSFFQYVKHTAKFKYERYYTLHFFDIRLLFLHSYQNNYWDNCVSSQNKAYKVYFWACTRNPENVKIKVRLIKYKTIRPKHKIRRRILILFQIYLFWYL